MKNVKLEVVDVSAQLLYWHTLGLRVPKYLEKFSAELGGKNIDQDQIKEGHD